MVLYSANFSGVTNSTTGKCFKRRLKILAEREDIAIRRAQILHRFEKFLFGFAQAEHDAGFGVNRFAAFGFHFASTLSERS